MEPDSHVVLYARSKGGLAAEITQPDTVDGLAAMYSTHELSTAESVSSATSWEIHHQCSES